MCIKYEAYELLELFENEPDDIVGEPLAGLRWYSKKVNGFELNLWFNLHENKCNISITYNNGFDVVFKGSFNNITQFKKYENDLIIIVKDEPTIKLRFKKQLSVELITEEEKERYKNIFSTYY